MDCPVMQFAIYAVIYDDDHFRRENIFLFTGEVQVKYNEKNQISKKLKFFT